MTRRKHIRTFQRGDFRMEFFRGSGAGGQHRNKTSSCVRITHIPTGLVGQCCDHRSQHANREVAFRRLATKLIGHEYPNAGSIRFSAGTKEVRAYKVEDDLVVDSTGVKGSFRAAGKDIGPMIEQRKRNLCDDE